MTTKHKDEPAETKPAAAKPASEAGAPAAGPVRKCGLVMPISAMEGLPASHWHDVKAIITEALRPDWSVVLVSDGDDAGVIQRRIVERLYGDEMVIVDVSARNPNVMFELGMRLAFDKPTVIVKDDVTPYPFDVAPNEYVDYPRDLRFQKIVDFQKRLAAKIEATGKPGHTTYLKSFGTFKVAKIETEEVPVDRLILDRLERMESMLRRVSARDAVDAAQSSIFREWRIRSSGVHTDVIPGKELERNEALCTAVKAHMLNFGVSTNFADEASSQFVAESSGQFKVSDIKLWCFHRGLIRPEPTS